MNFSCKHLICEVYEVLRGFMKEYMLVKQGKSGWFDSCDRPSNLTQIGFRSSIFQSVCPWWMTLKNNKAHLLYHVKLCASFQSHGWIQTSVTVRECSIRVKIGDFVPCDHEILWMTLKNNRAPFLYYAKFCASFQSHGWIQTGVTIRECPIRVKIGDFVPCNLEIWRMTLKNNRAPLLCYFKLCASFHSHQWIQTGVTVWNRHFWSIFFCPVWPWNLTDDLKKQQGTSSMLLQDLCIIS